MSQFLALSHHVYPLLYPWHPTRTDPVGDSHDRCGSLPSLFPLYRNELERSSTYLTYFTESSLFALQLLGSGGRFGADDARLNGFAIFANDEHPREYKTCASPLRSLICHSPLQSIIP